MKVPNFIQYGVQNLSLRNRKKKKERGYKKERKKSNDPYLKTT